MKAINQNAEIIKDELFRVLNKLPKLLDEQNRFISVDDSEFIKTIKRLGVDTYFYSESKSARSIDLDKLLDESKIEISSITRNLLDYLNTPNKQPYRYDTFDNLIVSSLCNHRRGPDYASSIRQALGEDSLIDYYATKTFDKWDISTFNDINKNNVPGLLYSYVDSWQTAFSVVSLKGEKLNYIFDYELVDSKRKSYVIDENTLVINNSVKQQVTVIKEDNDGITIDEWKWDGDMCIIEERRFNFGDEISIYGLDTAAIKGMLPIFAMYASTFPELKVVTYDDVSKPEIKQSKGITNKPGI